MGLYIAYEQSLNGIKMELDFTKFLKEFHEICRA